MHLTGQGRARIASKLQLSYSGVVKIIKLYENAGNVVPMPAVRGRKNGQQRLLTAEQELLLKDMIAQGAPSAYGLPYHLWGRDALAMLVHKQTGVDLPLRTVSHYMERWGYASSQLQNAVPAKKKIQEFRSKKQHAEMLPELCWLNRTLPPTLGNPAGEIISAINGRGSLRWLCLPAADKATGLSIFLQGLLADMKKNLLVLGLSKEEMDELARQISLPLQQANFHLQCAPEMLETDPEVATETVSWHFGKNAV